MKNIIHEFKLNEMKKSYLLVIAFISGVFITSCVLGQSPNLGTSESYALFTATGACTNTGSSTVTGDVGTNVGAFSGFLPGTVTGQINVANPASTTAATDVTNAYSQLGATTCGAVIGVGLGNGQILTPNVYCIGAATTLNGNLMLDAKGDPNALFIFKIDGALSTGVSSNVILINGASLCNVYWQINGEFDLGINSVFRGTLISNGAINLLAGSMLFGKGLSIAGAITLNGNVVSSSSPTFVAGITGLTNVCIGNSTSLTNSTTGGIWSSSNNLLSTVDKNGLVTSVSQGVDTIDYTVTNSIGCITRVGIQVTIHKNTTSATVLGATGICVGTITALSGTPSGGIWSSNNGAVATITNAGIVNGISSGATQFVFTNTATTCSATSPVITVNHSTTSSTTSSSCGSYFWNGVSYTASYLY